MGRPNPLPSSPTPAPMAAAANNKKTKARGVTADQRSKQATQWALERKEKMERAEAIRAQRKKEMAARAAKKARERAAKEQENMHLIYYKDRTSGEPQQLEEHEGIQSRPQKQRSTLETSEDNAIEFDRPASRVSRYGASRGGHRDSGEYSDHFEDDFYDESEFNQGPSSRPDPRPTKGSRGQHRRLDQGGFRREGIATTYHLPVAPHLYTNTPT